MDAVPPSRMRAAVEAVERTSRTSARLSVAATVSDSGVTCFFANYVASGDTGRLPASLRLAARLAFLILLTLLFTLASSGWVA